MIVPEADQDRIVALYQRGWTTRRIARETFWCKSTVSNVLHARGAYVRPRGGARRKVSAEDVLATAELYGRGYTLDQVGELLGLSRTAVRCRLIRSGSPLRAHGPVAARGKS